MIRDLFRILGPQNQGRYREFLVWAVLYGVMQGLAVALLVPAVQALFDQDWGSFLRWLAAMAVCAGISSIAHYLQAMKGFESALTLLRTMHLRLGDHLVTLPLGWFGAGRLGQVSQVASKGTISVMGAAAHLMTPIISGIASPATIVVCMLFFDWRLGLALMVSVPILFAAARFASTMTAKADDRAHAAAVESNNRVLEYARCQPVLRAFGRTHGVYEPLDDAIEAQHTAGRSQLWFVVIGSVVNGIALQFVFSAVIILGAFLALGGDIDPVTLIALLGLTARFIQPLGEIGEFGGAIRMARNEIRRMSEILEVEPLVEPDTSGQPTGETAVQFDAVDFGYADGGQVLRDISFEVPRKSLTALVGPSGSGKTTVTRLISRFYDVDSGVVRVGGVDVRDLTSADLMSQLSLVFQDVYLFDDTLIANIRLGRPEATDEDVFDVARIAGVAEIVERLPRGWDTRVGEGGTALSGGERQRVSIARALLKRAPIVLLDEATAALDPENEAHVQRAMQELANESTLLVIAHKLSTVVAADQIIVLGDDGSIVEVGTHEVLLAAGGNYAAFWNQRHRASGWRLVAG
ncbi:ABC transporter ATP-binding protein [Rhodococcus erythropolis]|uniref:ABC transporter ATP-binding protein n=1 Tax=Rhodococcus erythropolis TaxID=1833 RepID=UPI0036731F0C